MRHAFQIRSERGWTYDGVGEQSPSNTPETREAADAELPNLASVLGVDVSELRVVEVSDDFRAP